MFLSLSKKFDRMLAGKFRAQIFFLAILLLFIILVGTLLTSMVDEKNIPNQDEMDHCFKPFWWTFLHVTDPGYLNYENCASWKYKLLAWGLSFSGWLILAGFIISILVNAYNQRLEHLQKGLRRYSHRDHYFIIGWNSMGVSLVRQIFSDQKYVHKNTEIVILAKTPIQELRQILASAFSKTQNHAIYLYYGERFTDELKNIYCDSAREIIVLAADTDQGINNANLEVVSSLVELVNQGERKDVLNCYVHLPQLESFHLLKELPFPPSDLKRVSYRPFNSYDGWARNLWGGLVTDLEKSFQTPLVNSLRNLTDQTKLHLVIVGFGSMGQALLHQTAQVAHFGQKHRWQITVIDQELDHKKLKFLAQFPGILKVPSQEIEFMAASLYHEPIKFRLAEWAQDSNQRLLIALCLPNAEDAFVAAHLLPQQVLDAAVPVLINQPQGKGFSAMAEKFKYRFTFFGGQDEQCDLIRIQDQLAQGIHEKYLKKAKDDDSYDAAKPKFAPWENLWEAFRWSNRYQADSFGIKLALIHRTVKKADNSKPLEFTPEEVEFLAQIEHDRWCAERLLGGWQYGPERDDSRKIHPQLVPYDQLPENIKDYDRNAAKTMPDLLRKYCGLAVVNV